MVIGNPLLDISVWPTENTLLDKYGLKAGEACLASPEQMPIYAELQGMEGMKMMPGGAGLNSCRGARWSMKGADFQPKCVAYFGAIGSDEFGKVMEDSMTECGVVPVLHKDADTPTGTCAAVVVGKERSLCANLGACVKYPTSHLDENMKYLEAAKMVYATAFFITSNAEAMRKVTHYCAANDKPMLFNIAATWILHTNMDDVMDAIEHSDFVFCNEDEASLFAEKQGMEATDRLGAAKFICNYKKANEKRNRVCIVTQGPEPVIICEAQADGECKVT